MEERIAFCAELLSTHMNDSQAYTAIAQQFGITRRMAQAYVAKVYAQWEADAKATPAGKRSIMKERQRRRLLALAIVAQGNLSRKDGAKWGAVLASYEGLLMKIDGTSAPERSIRYTFDPSQCTDEELDRIEAGESPIAVLGPGRVGVA